MRYEKLVEGIHADVLDGRVIERMRLHFFNLGGNGDFLKAGASIEGITAKGFQCVRQLYLIEFRQTVELRGKFFNRLKEAELRESLYLLGRGGLESRKCLLSGYGLQLCERQKAVSITIECFKACFTGIIINESNTWRNVFVA